MKIPLAKTLFWFSVTAVLILSLMPGAAARAISSVDKIVHFAAFVYLSVLLLSTYTLPRPFLFVFIALCAFGILIEVLQYLLPYRRFSILDLIADIAGIIAGYLIYKIWLQKKRGLDLIR